MKYLSLFLLLFTATLHAQETRRVAVSEIPGMGLTYRLPSTGMRITVSAVRSSIQAGPFAPYAEKYLAIPDAAQQDEAYWSISSIDMSPVAVSDTSRIYHVSFRDKDALPTFYLTSAGFLTGINRQPENEQPAAVAPASKTVANIPLKATDVLSEDILKATSKAKQAELAAREIFSLRESVRDLVKGDVDNMPADGASLQIMVDNLRAQEQALMSLFVGTARIEEVTRTYEFIPTKEERGHVVFRFSRHFGFVDADDLSGQPYTVDVQIVEDQRMNLLNVEPKLLAKLKTPTGIAYCMPGKAKVTLSKGVTVITEGEYALGQLGHVEQLPVGQFTDKKKPTSALFDPLTGAIRLFESESLQ